LGSMCTSMLSVYENSDNTCVGPVVFPGLPISSASPGPCHDLPAPWNQMGSKSAMPPTYIPGTCEPMGGDPFVDGGVDGSAAEPTHPTVFCCRNWP
jgi:hypothetical protein